MATKKRTPRSPLAVNREQYNRYAEDYLAKRRDPKRNFYNEYLESPAITRLLRPIVNRKRVLDLGCGTGILTAKLAKWGANVVGVDNAVRMLELARRENPKIRFVKANASDLPFGDQSFDVVASSLVMHYIKNLNRPFAEVCRVLKRNGRFVFSFHHPFSTVIEIQSDKLRRQIKATALPYFHNNAYTWRMMEMELISFHQTFERVIEALNHAGFVVERLLETKAPNRARKVSRRDYEITSRFPAFCVIQAIKK
ncbi:MAG TPA: class I SAM-dependent methyltransferase [Candidatus Acidoferrum sp.]|nr:class I SAM-dependent methyltransferase [Candidatus Acidoferrum sp.]